MQLAIEIPDTLATRLDAHVTQHGWSRDQLAREAVLRLLAESGGRLAASELRWASNTPEQEDADLARWIRQSQTTQRPRGASPGSAW